MILQLELHDFAALAWVRNEGRVPVYRITHRDITAASTAATMARGGS